MRMHPKDPAARKVLIIIAIVVLLFGALMLFLKSQEGKSEDRQLTAEEVVDLETEAWMEYEANLNGQQP